MVKLSMPAGTCCARQGRGRRAGEAIPGCGKDTRRRLCAGRVAATAFFVPFPSFLRNPGAYNSTTLEFSIV